MTTRQRIAQAIRTFPGVKGEHIVRMLNLPVCLASIGMVCEVREAMARGQA